MVAVHICFPPEEGWQSNHGRQVPHRVRAMDGRTHRSPIRLIRLAPLITTRYRPNGAKYESLGATPQDHRRQKPKFQARATKHLTPSPPCPILLP